MTLYAKPQELRNGLVGGAPDKVVVATLPENLD